MLRHGLGPQKLTLFHPFISAGPGASDFAGFIGCGRAINPSEADGVRAGGGGLRAVAERRESEAPARAGVQPRPDRPDARGGREGKQRDTVSDRDDVGCGKGAIAGMTNNRMERLQAWRT